MTFLVFLIFGIKVCRKQGQCLIPNKTSSALVFTLMTTFAKTETQKPKPNRKMKTKAKSRLLKIAAILTTKGVCVCETHTALLRHTIHCAYLKCIIT